MNRTCEIIPSVGPYQVVDRLSSCSCNLYKLPVHVYCTVCGERNECWKSLKKNHFIRG